MGIVKNMLSPEKYIKTKARSLPIHECFINRDWQESGLASVLVSRRQPSGNLITGLYLVDLKCLGVKDTMYYFNQSVLEYEETKKSHTETIDTVPCEYTLAHNVIFASVEFAQEYNISPEKGFAITKFILDDDEDESVPLMDIECGEDGMPHLILFEEQVQKYTKVLAQLRSYPGEGNFLYTIQTADGDYDGGTGQGDEDNIEWDDMPLEDDFFDKVEKGEASVKDVSTHAITDLMYRKKFPEHKVDINEACVLMDAIDMIYEPMDKEGVSDYEKEKIDEMYLVSHEDPEGALTELFDLTRRFPQNRVLANYLSVALSRCNRSEEADVQMEKNYKDFPDYFMARVNYAINLLSRQRYDEALEIMHGPTLLGDFISGRKVHFTEALSFFFFWSFYYLNTGDLTKAEFYYRAVWNISAEDEKTAVLRRSLSKAKIEAMGINA